MEYKRVYVYSSTSLFLCYGSSKFAQTFDRNRYLNWSIT